MLNLNAMKNKNLLVRGCLIGALAAGVVLLPGHPAAAQTAAEIPQQTITLKDGSQIKGQVIAVEGAQYIIQTKDLGRVQIPADKVLSLTQTAAGSGTTPLQTGGTAATPAQQQLLNQIQPLQNQLLSDPQISAMLQDLISDPEVVKLLQDPGLMKDLMTMDPAVIQANPAMQKLLQNPAMLQIINQAGQKFSPALAP